MVKNPNRLEVNQLSIFQAGPHVGSGQGGTGTWVLRITSPAL